MTTEARDDLIQRLAVELDVDVETVRARLASTDVDALTDQLLADLAMDGAEVRARLAALGIGPVIGTDTHEEHAPRTKRSFRRRLAGALRPYAGRIGGVFIIDLIATPLALLLPIPLAIAIDSVLGHQPLPSFVQALMPASMQNDPDALLWFAVVLQVVLVVLNEAQTLASYFVRTRVGERMTLDVRGTVFRHAQSLSILRHDAAGTADSLYRVEYDAPSLQWLTTDGVVPLATSTVTLVAMVCIIFVLSWQLALVALAVCPVLLLLAHTYNRRMRARYVGLREVETDAMQVVQEVLSSLRVVKAFTREEVEHARFVERSGRGVDARVHLAFSEGLFGLLVNTTTALGGAAVLFIGIRSVQNGTLTLGELLVVIAYLAQLYAPLRTISRQAASMQSHLAGAGRVFDFLDEEPEVPQAAHPISLGRARGDVEFRDVAAGYGSGRLVLEHVSLDVPAGTRVGIGGRTGAGKTTLVSLLARFFDPVSGTVLVDGVDIRRYAVVDLRNQFAIVSQDPILLSATVEENIAYARSNASRDDIVRAATAANAHDFVSALPQGYATLVGERGMRLSGGERQRIALARAFLKDAPILILDEPTSSVDATTESVIMEAMERLMSQRTTFLITHRPGTLEHCDLRVTLEDGRIRSCTDHPRAPRRDSVVRTNVS